MLVSPVRRRSLALPAASLKLRNSSECFKINANKFPSRTNESEHSHPLLGSTSLGRILRIGVATRISFIPFHQATRPSPFCCKAQRSLRFFFLHPFSGKLKVRKFVTLSGLVSASQNPLPSLSTKRAAGEYAETSKRHNKTSLGWAEAEKFIFLSMMQN